MKKTILPLLLMLGMTTASAQEVIVGDMNDDNQLNISDVTTLVSTVLGKTPMRKISAGGDSDPYKVDNASIAGTWRTTTGEVITFNADGTCTINSTAYTFEYMPNVGFIAVYDAAGNCPLSYSVLEKTADMLLLNTMAQTEGKFYYTSAMFVTAIKLSSTSLNLNTGDTHQLTATVTPADAKVPTLKWTSSSTDVATVDQAGLVTAKNVGKATITAASTDGTGVKATCTVNITQPVTSVTFPYTTLTVGKGNTFTIDATVSPSDANNKTLTWTSSTTSSVMSLDDGVFYAKAAGTSTITAAATDGSGKKATCKVTVLSTAPTGVTLSESSITIEPTKTAQLTATVAPSDASSCTVVWTSSDPSIATVDQAGKVTGVANGKATITATVAGSSTLAASAEVTVQTDTHEYVDLGLSVKWATMNVGASSPEEYGNYYAWGETTTKSSYNWSTYKWCNGTYKTQIKYNNKSSYGTVDNKTTLDLADDAAYVNWGENWRMPTFAEQTELRTKCTWTWTTMNGKNGYKVTGSNGNSIFLPAAGYRNDSSLSNDGSYGYYWSSSLGTVYPYSAYSLYFDSSSVDWSNSTRCLGRSVRPVRRQ